MPGKLGPHARAPSILGADHDSAVLVSEFRKMTETAPRTTLADALAVAMQRSEAEFAEAFCALFDHSNSEQRCKVLSGLVGCLSDSSKGELVRARIFAPVRDGLSVVEDGTPELPADTSKSLAAEAARREPAIVRQVSEFYARYPNILKYLPAGTLGAVLRGMTGRA